jgi:hypothetical protein
VCGKCARDNTQYFSHDVGIAGKQKPKLKREAQYPLPNGHMGQHIINQQGAFSAIRRAPQLGLADHD